MTYECTDCGWTGDDPTEVESLSIKTCPECIARVEEAESRDPENPDSPQQPDGGDWEWNPTMRAGPGGPEIEPSDYSGYRGRSEQRDIL